MTDKYVTHEELLDILQPIQDGILENNKSCKNLTVSVMNLFKCLENMEYATDFQAAMFDVIATVERSVAASDELNDKAKTMLSKISQRGQKE